MSTVPAEVRQRLHLYEQDHVLKWWDDLSHAEQRHLLQQLQELNLDLLQQLYHQRSTTYTLPGLERVHQLPPIEVPPNARALGEESLRRGEVAALMVAGGQGSRLGFEHPKGMYPIGPVSNCTLFQIHAEKVLALSRRYGHAIPFLIMTSEATHAETETFFREKNNFGLDRRDVFFFKQGTMPAVDLATGKLLLESRSSLFTSPNGHGGTLTALNDSGLLDEMRRRGIRTFFYFQVDNPLVKVCDPVFLGHHLAARAEVSSKVVAKLGPVDKLGNLVVVDGRCTIIEYSDLPHAWAHRTDTSGRLHFWAGSPAIHLFDLEFLTRVTQDRLSMPYHIARKKVACIDANGNPVKPVTENALKFELFIFDVLPLAERWTVLETTREEEFEPLKNASGADSPETVRTALSELAADWLEEAEIPVPRTEEGLLQFPLEISPLFAVDADELAVKLRTFTLPAIQGPMYIR